MKRNLILALTWCLPAFVFAQEIKKEGTEEGTKEYPVYNNVVSINPFHFFDGTMQMDYERRQLDGKSTSYNVSLGFTAAERYYIKKFGFNAELQLRKYLISPKAQHNSDFHMQGLFAGVFGKAGYLDLEMTNYDYHYDSLGNYIEENESTTNSKIRHYSAGVLMGVQFSINNIITLETYLGGGVRYASVTGDDTENYGSIWDPDYIGVIPKAGFKVGVEF